MKVIVVGTGYVGLVSAVCLVKLGHLVTCIDKDQDKINILKTGESPIYEPGLTEMLIQQIQDNQISFSVFEPELIKDCDILIVAVGTPMSEKDGSADLTAVYEVIEHYVPHLSHQSCVVVKSTVPIGTNADLQNVIKSFNLNKTIDIASNPEFLREGRAITDFMHPDRIVIGATTSNAFSKMQTLYQPLIAQKYTYIETDITSAEIIKYASNAYLATKITFINEIANLCEKVGGDINQVALGMGRDQRIGAQFLEPGPGYGGSCFPKDTNALHFTAQSKGVSLTILNQVIATNTARFDQIASYIKKVCQKKNKCRTIGILGLTYKADTDDMRYSPAIEIVKRLQEPDISIIAYDPKAHSPTDQSNIGFTRLTTIDAVLKQADIVVIATEWEEFRLIKPQRFVQLMHLPCVYDLRNLFDPKIMKALRIEYHSIGRP